MRRSWTILGHIWALLSLLALLVGAVPVGLAGCDRGEGGQAPTGGTSAITVSCQTRVGDQVSDERGRTYRVVGLSQTSRTRHVSLAQDTTSGGSGGSSGDTTIIVTVNCPKDSPTTTNPPPEGSET